MNYKSLIILFTMVISLSACGKIDDQVVNNKKITGELITKNKEEVQKEPVTREEKLMKKAEDECKNKPEDENKNCKESVYKDTAYIKRDKDFCELLTIEEEKTACIETIEDRIKFDIEGPTIERCDNTYTNKEQLEFCYNEVYFYKASKDKESALSYCEKITAESTRNLCKTKFTD